MRIRDARRTHELSGWRNLWSEGWRRVGECPAKNFYGWNVSFKLEINLPLLIPIPLPSQIPLKGRNPALHGSDLAFVIPLQLLLLLSRSTLAFPRGVLVLAGPASREVTGRYVVV